MSHHSCCYLILHWTLTYLQSSKAGTRFSSKQYGVLSQAWRYWDELNFESSHVVHPCLFELHIWKLLIKRLWVTSLTRCGLCSASGLSYRKPVVRTKFGEFAFSFSGPAALNSLPVCNQPPTWIVLSVNSKRIYSLKHFTPFIVLTVFTKWLCNVCWSIVLVDTDVIVCMLETCVGRRMHSHFHPAYTNLFPHPSHPSQSCSHFCIPFFHSHCFAMNNNRLEKSINSVWCL